MQADSDCHDDEVRSHGSSASSSPRYPASMLSHLAASMSASNRGAAAAAAGPRGMPRLAGGQYPGYQQPMYGAGGAGLQHGGRMPLVSSPQEGMAMPGSPAYMPSPSHAQGAQRASPVGVHGYRPGWPQQGALFALFGSAIFCASANSRLSCIRSCDDVTSRAMDGNLFRSVTRSLLCLKRFT